MKKLPRKGGSRSGKRSRFSGHQDRRQPRFSRELLVLYEDDAVVVLDKPAGLPAVPVKGSDTPSAWSLLSAKLKLKGQRALVVHRIDRFTSGVLLFAKTEPDRDTLVRQFLAHTPVRQYLAVVRGCPGAQEGTLVHYFRREGMFQTVAHGERLQSGSRGTSISRRTPSPGRFAGPGGVGDGVAESDPGAVFGDRPPGRRRQKIQPGGIVGAANCPRCSSCGASSVHSSTLGRERLDRLRTTPGFSVSSSGIIAASPPAPVSV